MKILLLSVFLVTLSVTSLKSQNTDANIFGDVQSEGEHIPFANVYIEGTAIGTTTDASGHYMLVDLPEGKHTVVAKALGYTASKKEVYISVKKSVEINFVLEKDLMMVTEVVVTGTKTVRRSTETPVIVNVIDAKNLEAVQSCNISDGLRFQPGLRIETDCQTCNYTQLRMNGLGGGYSQVLINGRPIFSPLIGLYGLEQIPSNMVDRIEVVRGGGSALYGSSAIGGTVNVITRIPDNTDYSVNMVFNSINNASADNVLNANVTMVTKKKNAGVVLFANRRHRQSYDHPGITLSPDGSKTVERDNFSELPELRNNSFGGNIFYRPTSRQKVEINFTSLYEYRYGGEMIDKAAHLAQQSEERAHDIFMGGIDYQVNFNNDNSLIIAYLAGQHTDRDHYTGLYPARSDFDTDSAFNEAEQIHLKNPPYGFSGNTTIQGGLQIDHKIENFFFGSNVFSAGVEYLNDNILDSIPQYRYGTMQATSNVAAFFQSDWKISPSLTLLTGVRADRHNLADHLILSPRISFLYRLKEYTQFRITWGTGFRAPQAFDTDMHIAFAGGGVSRISLADNLKEERSNSYSGSINFDLPRQKYIVGFTVEGFYTKLNDAFYLQPVGEDNLGEQFEKRNGPGASVRGATIELRGNYNKKAQIEAGLTIQSSLHDKAVENIEGLPPKRKFLRAPDEYGYLIITFNPATSFNASVSSLYTGSMLHAKFSAAENVEVNEYRTSPSSTEINLKLGYTLPLETIDSGIEIYGGIKNITNNFQDDFDNYRNRDSNYVYGPSQPRTFYIGIKLKTL